MKIYLDRRDRGVGLLAGIILFALFLLFIGGLAYILISACQGIGGGTFGGTGAATNELANYTGPGMVTYSQSAVISPVPTNIAVFEQIDYSEDLLMWQPLTNVVLSGQVFNWSSLIDKSRPVGFFKITLYSTNTP